MKIAYFPNQVAFNGQNTLNAFLEGAKKHNFIPVENSFDADAAVIWSVLWNGRLARNELVYNTYRNQEKPVFILEVGALKRGQTWKVSLNHITSQGIYGNQENLDILRPARLGIKLHDQNLTRKNHILIAGQHQKSLQWSGQLPLNIWALEKIKLIRQYTDRPILVRPHPRSKFVIESKEASLISPIKLANTHEEYDIDYNCHCVINHNSGPSISSAIHGVPIICDKTSLAWEVSDVLENIENIQLKDRRDWFIKICHTEWTNQEISEGIPIARLLPYIIR